MDSSPTAIVWMFDAGAEGPFPVCLFSLMQAARALYVEAPLVLLDYGISDNMRTWLQGKRLPNLRTLSCKAPDSARIIGSATSRAAAIMRQRIEVPRLLETLMNDGQIPYFRSFLVLDTDTIFIRDPTAVLTTPWKGEDIRCCYEWDWIGEPTNNHQESMKFIRPSSFISERYPDVAFRIADALSIEVGELLCIPTVNSGVWMSQTRGTLSDEWLKMYHTLCDIENELGPGLFDAYSAEQNALSLSVHFGKVSIRCLSRTMNHLPPRDPHDWPGNVIIAHFVTFKKNLARSAYRLWSGMRDSAARAGFAPQTLLMPEMR